MLKKWIIQYEIKNFRASLLVSDGTIRNEPKIIELGTGRMQHSRTNLELNHPFSRFQSRTLNFELPVSVVPEVREIHPTNIKIALRNFSKFALAG